MKKSKETGKRGVNDSREKKHKSPAAKKSNKEFQQEELYRILAENSFGGVYVVQDGIFRFLNHHAAAYAGYTVEELTGKPAPSIVHPEDKEKARKYASNMLKGERSSPYKFRIIDRSGATRLILETVTSINYEGRPAVLGNSMDITEIKEAEELYRLLAEKSFGGVYVVQDGIFRFLNHHAAAYAGYTVEELTGKPAPSIVHPEDKEMARKHVSNMLKGKRSSPYEFRIIDKNGVTRWIMETVTSVCYQGRQAVLGNSMDITELRNVTQKMEEQKALADSIISAMPQAVLVLKKDVIVFASDAVETIFGWKPGEVIGNDIRMFYKSDHDFKDSSRYIKLILEKENTCSLETRHKRKDGIEITCMQYNSRIGRHEKNGKIAAIFEDITARKQAEEALRESEKRYLELSITDGLTRLYNTRHCYNILESEVARAGRFKHPLTLLMMDIDNFKRFNDTYGHMEGDQVLTRFAEVIRRSIRKVDHACRYGGEEFIVILPETTADHGVRVAERIRNEFKKEVFTPKAGITEQVTVSIGVAQLTPPEESADFIKRADKRLYKAKEQGKDRVVF